MSERTVVYVCDHGLVKVADDINIWQQGLVVASHPAVAKYPQAFRIAGTVGADGLARMDTLGPWATLLRLLDYITPISDEPASSDPAAPPDTGLGRRRRAGRPPWDRAAFWRAYDKARDALGGTRATDAQIAEVLLIQPRQLSRLVARFGLPPE